MRKFKLISIPDKTIGEVPTMEEPKWTDNYFGGVDSFEYDLKQYQQHLQSLHPSPIILSSLKPEWKEGMILEENVDVVIGYEKFICDGWFECTKEESERALSTFKRLIAHPVETKAEAPIEKETVWIKASERRPEYYDNPDVHYRVDGKKVSGIFISPDCFEYKELSRYVTIEKENFYRVEWLDESGSCPCAVYRKTLEKIVNIKANVPVKLDWKDAREMIDIANAALSAEGSDGWIKIEDGCKMPEASVEVMIYTSYRIRMIAILEGDQWFSGDESFSIKLAKSRESVTHWRYLPQPPIKK